METVSQNLKNTSKSAIKFFEPASERDAAKDLSSPENRLRRLKS